MDPGESWLDLDTDFESDAATKDALLREQRGQVFVEEPGSRAAQDEALATVIETLAAYYPGHLDQNASRFRVASTGFEFDLNGNQEGDVAPPLERAARCVQEDLVVMEERPSGWCLTAACVCFPTRWDLPTQLGLPMTQIHKHVPGYREQLDAGSNRFFDGMTTGLVFRRGNWSLLDDPALFQLAEKHPAKVNADITAENAGESIWLRVEHQTLQRLPKTGGVLFGIRIHRTRLDEVGRNAKIATELVGAIETMHPDMQRYKALARVRRATLDYLRSASDEG